MFDMISPMNTPRDSPPQSRPSEGHRDPLQVVALAYDGLSVFEFGVVVEIFGRRRPEIASWYDFRVAAVEPGPLRGLGGITIEAAGGLDLLDRAGTIVVPGWRDPDEMPPEGLSSKLRKAHAAGARILSLCSGAFVLAAAGLLNGRRATTHWRYAAALAARYPEVTVDADVLYVDEGNVLTSAGSAAAIDLCLHLVRRDRGAIVANTVARRLVVQPHRSGGQKQFIESPVAESPQDGLAAVLDGIRSRIEEPHTVSSMARTASLSSRTFLRRFSKQTGTTPHRWLVSERVRRAQDLLETTDLPLDLIAEASGFSDSQLLRLHFRRLVGNPPSAYRKMFRL